MTKGQIEKHREVILWFIENPDKGIWRKDTPTNDWYLDLEPTFYEDFTYVKNDYYAEFRKAEIDGKQIQSRRDNFYGDTISKRGGKTDWIDVTMKEYDKSPQYCDIEFRIKPEEPKFKAGDWAYYRDEKDLVLKQLDITDDIKWVSKLWKPQVGEFVVFTNAEKQEYYIKKFTDDVWTDNIAPLEFINTLKD